MQCPICLANPQIPTTLDCCKNTYCQPCITTWKKVKTTCPLCCRTTTNKGQTQVNELKVVNHNQNFDDGFLMLQTQMKQITARLGHLKIRISNRKQDSKKIKSGLSASLLQYLEQQLQKMNLYQSLMHEQFLLHNRPNTVQYMQLISYQILKTQQSLQNNSVVIEYDDFDYDYEEEMYMDEVAEQFQQSDYYEQVINKKAYYKSKKNKGGGVISPQKTKSVK